MKIFKTITTVELFDMFSRAIMEGRKSATALSDPGYHVYHESGFFPLSFASVNAFGVYDPDITIYFNVNDYGRDWVLVYEPIRELPFSWFAYKNFEYQCFSISCFPITIEEVVKCMKNNMPVFCTYKVDARTNLRATDEAARCTVPQKPQQEQVENDLPF